MTTNGKEKRKWKLNFTRLYSNHTENNHEKGFWLWKIVLISLGNQRMKKHSTQHAIKLFTFFQEKKYIFFIYLFIYSKNDPGYADYCT